MPPTPSPLPNELEAQFSVSRARGLGVTPSRLRASDLERPRRGVRVRASDANRDPAPQNDFEAHERHELRRIAHVAQILNERQFFSHRSAALLWGAPVRHLPGALVHVGVLSPLRSPRAAGVVGHNLAAERCSVAEANGLRLTDPATTWALSGHLSLTELVALGDFFVRVYRQGYGRRNAGKRPLAEISDLAAAAALGRWRGAPKLRRALELIREDSWSPRESAVRVELVSAGLPEPELNIDVYDEDGTFLGCLDMAYRRYRVGVEYHGNQHGERYAADVERAAGLRAAGWDLIEVTSELGRRPDVVVRRVEAALRRAGWRG